MIMAMWGPLCQPAEEVRSRGYTAKDFHPENAVFLGGGLKGANPHDAMYPLHRFVHWIASEDGYVEG